MVAETRFCNTHVAAHSIHVPTPFSGDQNLVWRMAGGYLAGHRLLHVRKISRDTRAKSHATLAQHSRNTRAKSRVGEFSCQQGSRGICSADTVGGSTRRVHNMRFFTIAVSRVLASGLLLATSRLLCAASMPAVAWAQPEAVGEEFAANQYEVEQLHYDYCIDPAGRSIRLVFERNEEGAFAFVARFYPNGDPLGERQEVSSTAVSAALLTCARDGSFAVAWSDPGNDCWLLRSFDSSFSPVGGSTRMTTDGGVRCRRRHLVELKASPKGYTALWASPVTEDGTISLRNFDVRGAPISSEAAVVPTPRAASRGLVTAVDADGNTLLAWSLEHDDHSTDVLAQVVTADGTAMLPLVTIRTGASLASSYKLVDSPRAGVFLVRWTDWEEGGWLGRWVSIDPVRFPAPFVTTTTLPAPRGLPLFLDPLPLYGRIEWAYELPAWPALGTDGQGNWVSSWYCF